MTIRNNQSGSATIESAIILPVVFFVIYSVFQLTLYLYDMASIHSVVRSYISRHDEVSSKNEKELYQLLREQTIHIEDFSAYVCRDGKKEIVIKVKDAEKTFSVEKEDTGKYLRSRKVILDGCKF